MCIRDSVEDSQGNFDALAKRLIYGMLLTMGLFSMGVLYALEAPEASVVAAVFSAALTVLLYRSFRKPRSIGAKPQFTRQNLRQQRRTDEE